MFRNLFVSTIRKTPDDIVLICNRIDNSRNDKKCIFEYLATLHSKYWDNEEKTTKYYNIVNSLSQINRPTTSSNTEQDLDCYEFFTKELFKSIIYCKHKMSKRLSACKTFIPDYKLGYEFKLNQTMDLFIMEIKKEAKSYTPDKVTRSS